MQNASMCVAVECGNALSPAQYVDSWDSRDVCISAGCLYQAAILQTVTLVVDPVTSLLYPIEELQPVLQITPRCGTGISSSQFYWKDESYCETSSAGTNTQQVYQRYGSNLSVNFMLERPGLYTLSLSLQSLNDGAVWTAAPVDIDVQPGPPSFDQSTLTYQLSASSTTVTPQPGAQYDFGLQVLDANANPRFGLEDVLIDLRMAENTALNAYSQAIQPTLTYVHTAATPRLGANVATDVAQPTGNTSST